MKELRGTGVAIVTPFDANGQVDYAAFSGLIETYVHAGIDYIVALGTTAETATLTTAEKQKVARHIVALVDGRLPLVYGLGGNNTQALVDELATTDFTGYSAILSVCPYYNRPNQQGIYLHYSAIAKAAPLPVILYNVPSRTGVSIANSTTLALAKDHSNIIGIKDATGDLTLGKELIAQTPEHFLVLSGDDSTAFHLTLAGGDGVISVIGGGLPEAFSRLIRFGFEGKKDDGEALLQNFLSLISLLFEEGNPTGLKALLHQQNAMENQLRLPLVSASESLYERIRVAAQNID